MKTFFTTGLLIFITVHLTPISGQWVKTVIDENIDRPTSFIPGDIDGDGDVDIAATIYGDASFVWYENDNKVWPKHIIDGTIAGVGVFIADIDGDDTLDLTLAGWSANKVIWYKNEGGSPITWTPYTIDDNLGGAEFVHVDDIDSDGDPDVVATGYNSSKVVWYENDGGMPISWTKHTIDADLGRATLCYAVDIDGDDTLDVVANGQVVNDVVWYKNENAGQNWTKHFIDDNLGGANEFDVADIDSDGDPDVAATGHNANDVVWYENGGGTPVSWTKHTIDADLGGAFAVSIADMDASGTLDIVATGNSVNDVVWYANDGLSPIGWNKLTIDGNLSGVWEVRTVDINEDSFPDVVANQRITNGSVVWYENAFARIVEIPDTAFLHALIDEGVDTNGDSLISYGEAEGITYLNIDGPHGLGDNYQYGFGCEGISNITNLTGIEAFENLDTLRCMCGSIETLDLSGNQKLKYLNCSYNQLSSLNVSNNTALIALKSDSNQLTSLDVSHNIALEELFCNENQLTSLDVSTNTALVALWCSNNLLTSLDVSNNTSIRQFCPFPCTTGLALDNMPTLHEVCVWTTPFPPDSVYVDTTGSPNVCFQTDCNGDCTIEITLTVENDNYYQPDSVSATSYVNGWIYLVDNDTAQNIISIRNTCIDSVEANAKEPVKIDVSGLGNGTYWLYATDTDGNISDPVAFAITGVGVEYDKAENIKMYPNPANKLLTVEIAITGLYAIDITSLSGQQLYSNKMEETSHQIDLSSFPKGVYFLTIRSKDFVTTRKIIKL